MFVRKSIFAKEFWDKGFIFGSFDIDQDLINSLPKELKDFNNEFIPIYLHKIPEKSKFSTGSSCGFPWTKIVVTTTNHF